KRNVLPHSYPSQQQSPSSSIQQHSSQKQSSQQKLTQQQVFQQLASQQQEFQLQASQQQFVQHTIQQQQAPNQKQPPVQPVSASKSVTNFNPSPKSTNEKSGSIQDLTPHEDKQIDDGPITDESFSKHTDSDDSPQVRSMASIRKRERPASARPAPPKQRTAEIALEEIPSISPAIFQEGITKLDEDDDDYIILPNDMDVIGHHVAPVSGPSGVIGKELHGGLVRKILETKKDLEGGGKSEESEIKTVSDGNGIGKDRTNTKKEIVSLRESIQTLCRSTNPLGKMIDYMQEDVDSMNKELEMWRNETQKKSDELLEPIGAQLKQIERSIEEQVEKSSNTKATILQNDIVIANLLRNITNPIH
ncbi:TRAF3-interacting protein 1, partial [Nowakowskiella sp. JEL0078]